MAQRWPDRCGSLTNSNWLATLAADRVSLLKRLDVGDTSAVADGNALVARVRAALLALPLHWLSLQAQFNMQWIVLLLPIHLALALMLGRRSLASPAS